MVMILNDNFSEIEREPAAFVNAIRDGMNVSEGKDIMVPVRDAEGQIRVYRHVGKVIQTDHADGTQVVVTNRNQAEKIMSQYYVGSDQIDVLKALANKLGYNISKKPSKKEKTIDPATDDRQELMGD